MMASYQYQYQHKHEQGGDNGLMMRREIHFPIANQKVDPPTTSVVTTTHHIDKSSSIIGKMAKNNKNKIRKQKFAFHTRSQVDILDDGYRWRKYGQKAVKNNRFPRSYYRCTHPECNVKKQVQRLSKDESVVVTTYEGVHTHPVEKPSDNFEQILNQMQIYPPLF